MKCISMIGRFGCYPDNSEDHDSFDEACSYLSETLELTTQQKDILKKDGFLKLNYGKGADYCEIVFNSKLT